jgi:hypothetical protein
VEARKNNFLSACKGSLRTDSQISIDVRRVAGGLQFRDYTQQTSITTRQDCLRFRWQLLTIIAAVWSWFSDTAARECFFNPYLSKKGAS